MDYTPFFRYPETYKNPLEKSLALIKEAVQDEKNDELFYDYLISIAPTPQEKQIIESIRDDERRHNKMFRKIYKDFTGMDITSVDDEPFKKPNSYLDGLEKALFGELNAVKKYREIRAGLPQRDYRDMVFEILTDELIHANKYNFMITQNKSSNKRDELTRGVFSPKTSFTSSEASKIAEQLGINFNEEQFDLEQFRMGLDIELEHGRKYYPTNVTHDDPILTGKIALAHLKEFPDYYTRLEKLEAEAKAYWDMMNRQYNGENI